MSANDGKKEIRYQMGGSNYYLLNFIHCYHPLNRNMSIICTCVSLDGGIQLFACVVLLNEYILANTLMEDNLILDKATSGLLHTRQGSLSK